MIKKKNYLHADASIAPRSQIMRQFLLQLSPNWKNVFSIWIIVFKRFSWNLKAVIKEKKKKQNYNYFMKKIEMYFNERVILMTASV